MLCEKTHTQLPLADLVDLPGAVQNPPGNNAPPAETENSEGARKREYNQKYYAKNREKLKADTKRYRDEHPGTNKEACRRRYSALTQEQRRIEQQAARARRLAKDPDCDNRRAREHYKNDAEHRAKRLAANKAWQLANPDKHRQIARDTKRNRVQSDPVFRLRCLMATRIHQALAGELKRDTTIGLLGCSREEFKAHLESKFQPGMTWENLGIGAGTWQIDHITPIDTHDLSTLEGQRAAFHCSNTQPLWYEDHQRKSATEATGWRKLPSCPPPP